MKFLKRIPGWFWAIAVLVLLGAIAWFVLSLIFGEIPARRKVFEFITSPGMAGVAAVVAATIAAINISEQIRQSRQAELRQDWWTNFKWATERAVPTDDTAIAVPYSTSIATLQTLACATNDSLQKAACGTFVDLLAKLAAAPSASGKSDPGRFQALRNYDARTKGSDAESEGAQRVLYERGFLNALEHIAVVEKLGYAQNVVLSTGDDGGRLRVQGGSSIVDAKLICNQATILFKFRRWAEEPKEDVLQRRIAVTVGRIKQAESKAAVVIVLPFGVSETIAAAQLRDVRVLTWREDSESAARLKVVIDELSELS